MSDFRAIGDVSTTLRLLLRDRMELPPDVTRAQLRVTVETPRAEEANGEAVEDPRINLFLYRVTENAALKNQEIPGTGNPAAYGRPPLSLNLYYLVTAYGSTADDGHVNETRAHHLLGSAMRVLHDHAVVTEALKTIHDPVDQPILQPALIGEFERVKLTLEPLSLDDVTKVWTALTLPYRLSSAYLVSVVQIEGRAPRTYPRRVAELEIGGPKVIVVPFRSPRIDEIRVRRPGDPPETERPAPHARVGDTVILRGVDFGGDKVRVRVGALALEVKPSSERRVEFVVPDATRPGGGTIPEKDWLQPGAHTVTVNHLVEGLPEAGIRSNVGVFMVVPKLDSVAPATGPSGTTITLQGTRLYSGGATNLVIVGDKGFPVKDPDPPTPPTQKASRIKVKVEGLPAGTYPVRVRVNGAESLEEKSFQVT